jgi:hypothetical protein
MNWPATVELEIALADCQRRTPLVLSVQATDLSRIWLPKGTLLNKSHALLVFGKHGKKICNLRHNGLIADGE